MLECLYQDISLRGELVILAAEHKLYQDLTSTQHQENIKLCQDLPPEPKSFIECELEADMFLLCNCGFVPSWTWGGKLGCARVGVRRLIAEPNKGDLWNLIWDH